MNVNTFRISFLVLFMLWVSLAGSLKCWAQDDDSDQQANQADIQEALKQIHADEQDREKYNQLTLDKLNDLESKMNESAKHLDAMEKAIDQTNTETAPGTEAPPQEAPAQVAAPVQLASAQTTPQEHVYPQAPIYYPPATFLPKEHTFELSQEEFYSTFKESGNYEVYKKSGAFFGLNMAYTYRPLNSEDWLVNVLHIDVHGDYGIMDYNYEGDKINSVNNYIVEPRIWVGKDFDLDPFTTITPYIGGGYRWYFDQLKNKTDDAGDGGFNIQTQYAYIPIGTQVLFRQIEGWDISFNAESDIVVWGREDNYLSQQYAPVFSNISNTLRGGYGLRGSFKIMKKGDFINYFVEPYIRFWSIKSSGVSQIKVFGVPGPNYQEDKNHTTEVGARFGVEF